MRLAGRGMSPTLEKGERTLYEKHVEPARLRRGTVIVYRLSAQSAWSEPGWLVISRILAVPGDQISMRSGRYLVNGQPGPAVATTNPHQPVLEIPTAPATLTMPEQHYFTVQDSPSAGYDSRVLSWVKAEDIVTTQLYYLSGRGFLKPVE